MTSQEVFNIYQDCVIGNYTRNPVVIVRGKGSWVWDAEGKKYLDLFPGWGVNGLGHCHPRVVRAVKEQASILMHVANNYYNQPQAELARVISEKSFGGKCFFCNSGAEAVEAAVKLARLYGNREGRFKIITMENSFHGRTLAATAATGQVKYQQGFEPLPAGFVHVPLNDLEALRRAVDDQTVGVMIEPIQGEGGINIASEEYLRNLRALCDERRLLLIFDEVQTGMGRTGKYFAYQHSSVAPDIMTLAKALGGGLAIGAMVAKSDLAALLVPGTHASTFGGNPIASRAALATFEAIEKDNLLENAQVLGDFAFSQLAKMKKKLPCIKEVRGKGFMIGVELTFPGSEVVRKCMEEGLLVNCTHERVIRLMPALTVKKSELRLGLSILRQVLETASAIKECSPTSNEP